MYVMANMFKNVIFTVQFCGCIVLLKIISPLKQIKYRIDVVPSKV